MISEIFWLLLMYVSLFMSGWVLYDVLHKDKNIITNSILCIGLFILGAYALAKFV
jgi:uncharacterized membrane protein YoaT (DUF817 family)